MDPKEIFKNRYYIFNRIMLQILCIWPYQEKKLILFGRFCITFAIYSMMIPQIIRSFQEFFSVPRDVEVLVENFAGFMYFHAVLAKFWTTVMGKQKFRYLYEQITTDWKNITDEGEKAVLQYHANIARLLTIVYMIYMFSACIGFVWSPLLIPAVLNIILPLNVSRTKVLCYYAEYYIDQQEYLYYLAMHTFICVSLTILIFTAVDSTYVSTVYHAVALYKLIDYRMKKICSYVQDKYWYKTKISADQLHNYIIDSIKIHRRTIEFANLIQTCYSDCLFFVTGLVLLCLSVGSIDIIYNLDNFINLFRIGFVWVGIIIYIFYVNWPGQKLADSSSELFTSLYFSGWNNFPLKTQYLIKFMMMRSIIPFQLTAGPLLDLNFQTCSAILKTALSYFTAMASFN